MHLAVIDLPYALFVLVDAHDPVPEVRKARSRHQLTYLAPTIPTPKPFKGIS